MHAQENRRSVLGAGSVGIALHTPCVHAACARGWGWGAGRDQRGIVRRGFWGTEEVVCGKAAPDPGKQVPHGLCVRPAPRRHSASPGAHRPRGGARTGARLDGGGNGGVAGARLQHLSEALCA